MGARIENAIRRVRDGKLNSSQFGSRLAGSGLLAEQIHQLFKTFAKKHGLDDRLPEYDFTQFRPPATASGQLRLF